MWDLLEGLFYFHTNCIQAKRYRWMEVDQSDVSIEKGMGIEMGYSECF